MSEKTKINGIIAESLSGLRDMIDVDMIMGDPIVANGTTIIPVSKVAVGLASGGIESGKFGGGGGSGVSLSPVGFLVVKSNGQVDLLSISGASGSSSDAGVVDTVIDVIDRSPELFDKLKEAVGALIGKDKNKSEE